MSSEIAQEAFVASTIEKIQRRAIVSNQTSEINLVHETFTAVGATSDSKFSECDICVQVTGTASSVTLVVERNLFDPGYSPGTWAPVESETFTGTANALAPRLYEEPATAYWRVRVGAIAGGNAVVTITGVSV
jgi:hypothetical protein